MTPPQPYSPRGSRKKAKSVKVADSLWNAVKAKAEKRGETITDVVVRKFEEYLAEED